MVENDNSGFSGNDANPEAVAQNLMNNFDSIPENMRNDQFLHLLEKSDVNLIVGRILLIILNEHFDRLPENLRNELLLKFSKNDKFASDVEKIVSANSDKIPQDILNKVSENIRDMFPVQTKSMGSRKRKKPPGIKEAEKPMVRAAPPPEVMFNMQTRRRLERGETDKDIAGTPSDRKVSFRESIIEASTFKAPPRYADITFYYYGGEKNGQEVPKGHTLQADYDYQLEVAVRIETKGLPVKGDKREKFREPGQKQNVTIYVTADAEKSEYLIEDPVQTLILPPVGDSIKNAFFKVQPLMKSSSNNLADIRIRLFYEFNLIEEIRIYAEVVGKFEDPTGSHLGLAEPISISQERLKYDNIDFDNILPRAMHIQIGKKNDNFLFEFSFYNAIEKKIVFNAQVGLKDTDLEDGLKRIRNIWYDIAMNKTYAVRLEGDKDEFLKHIHNLADEGHRLWVNLFKGDPESSIFKIGAWLESHPLIPGSIIQVSIDNEAANFVFPWSLLYDRPVPEKDYEQDPDGFWGLRYCIEQKLLRKNDLNKVSDASIHIPDELKIGFMLYDKFRNTEKEKSMLIDLKERSAGRLDVTDPITDKDECYNLLKNCDAHILYFYTHGYTRHRQDEVDVQPGIELFKRLYENLSSSQQKTYKLLYESIKQGQFKLDSSWIELTNGKLYLENLNDIITDLKSRPLVILNMCESAQVIPSLSDSFIKFFLTRGAIGVVGTECPMTIEFAHPFAEAFLADLLAGEQVGMVLRNARRHFIELKNPLGLAYTLFGSATARFEPAVL